MGKGLADVRDLVEGPEWRANEPKRYEMRADGIAWRHNEVLEPITNFTACIVKDTREDDGVEQRRTYTLDVTLGGRTRTVTTPSEEFPSCSWATEAFGAKANTVPGRDVKDRIRHAVQDASYAQEEMVFTHLGWARVNDVWAFLHADGAIGVDGFAPGVITRPHGNLKLFKLPNPPRGEELREAIRASLRILDVAPDSVVFPLYMAVWRAVLGDTPFSVHLAGQSGAGKSVLAALIQQHFGAELHYGTSTRELVFNGK